MRVAGENAAANGKASAGRIGGNAGHPDDCIAIDLIPARTRAARIRQVKVARAVERRDFGPSTREVQRVAARAGLIKAGRRVGEEGQARRSGGTGGELDIDIVEVGAEAGPSGA